MACGPYLRAKLRAPRRSDPSGSEYRKSLANKSFRLRQAIHTFAWKTDRSTTAPHNRGRCDRGRRRQCRKKNREADREETAGCAQGRGSSGQPGRHCSRGALRRVIGDEVGRRLLRRSHARIDEDRLRFFGKYTRCNGDKPCTRPYRHPGIAVDAAVPGCVPGGWLGRRCVSDGPERLAQAGVAQVRFAQSRKRGQETFRCEVSSIYSSWSSRPS